MLLHTWISLIVATTYICLIIVFAIAIVMRRRPVGVSLAWLVLLFALPLAGMFAYLILGNQRLGVRRLVQAKELYSNYHKWRVQLSQFFLSQWQGQCIQQHSRLYRLIENTMDVPALPGNELELYLDSDNIIKKIEMDIRTAQHRVNLEFYIWWPEGATQKILKALKEAVKRGVKCKVLLDAVGSRYFLQQEDVDGLRNAGVSVEASLPVGPVRMFFERIDIRNHRKIVTIDDRIAWTGSFNLIDHRYFKQDQKVGQWIDAMVRVEGPSAHMMNAVFLWDWQLTTEYDPELFSMPPACELPDRDGSYIHVLPSSPRVNRERLHHALLTAIYESEEEIVITTPYFVPDDALFSALISAAKRGVNVHLLLPKTTDSRLARFASRSYYQSLLEANAQIHLFNGGLLHTKCVLVDRSTVLFGSVNMDMRSVWLNMELTLVIYDRHFAEKIGRMIDGYKQKSIVLELDRWKNRSFIRRLGEGLAQLVSPLL